MKAYTTLIGELAKALRGNAEQQAGDTGVIVPGLLQPVIEVPLPNNVFRTVDVLGIVTAKASFMQSSDSIMTGGANNVINTLESGLWHVFYRHWLTNNGAVDDDASFASLRASLVEGTNPQVFLTHLVGNIDSPLHLEGEFFITLPAGQTLQFNHFVAGGVGTSTWDSHIVLICQRLL